MAVTETAEPKAKTNKAKYIGERLSTPVTRGVDHLALVTDDMAETMEFYTKVMGMQLVHVRRVPYAANRGQPPHDNLRHYFFGMGNDSLLAFFEYPEGLERSDRDLPGGMQHLAFHVPSGQLDAMVDHVKSCGIDVVGPVSLGGRFWSAYFYDNNGIRLELATSLAAEDVSNVESVLQTDEEARGELETLFGNAGRRGALVEAHAPRRRAVGLAKDFRPFLSAGRRTVRGPVSDAMDSFSYDALPTRVLFGSGTCAELGSEAARLGLARLIILSTPRGRPLAEQAANSLGDRAAGVFDGA